MKMIAALAQKIGLHTKFITDSALEDIALANAMKKGRTGEFVNTDAYLKKLKGK